MKKILCLALCLFCIFSTSAFASSGDNEVIPAEVQQAADQGLKSFIAEASMTPTDYGYSNADEVSKVQLGKGAKLYAIDKGLFGNASKKLTDYSTDTNTWIFTIDLNGSPKNFLTIGQENGQFKVVQVGGNASNFGAARAKIEKEYGTARVFQGGLAYYFAAESNGKDVILSSVPQQQAKSLNALGNDNYKSTDDIINFFKNQNTSAAEQQRGGQLSETTYNTNTSYILIGVAIVVVAIGAFIILKRRTSRV
ncbi:hypothetical protein [Paenibacillus durus]|uniref:Gram-positive cocci surface proteins LPxTG domain-containing protein n=1 Tax=Paenibacillus durus ATCC 35681 TaxID=1333534 RepID=A0A0F7FA34_PAEDU|nr:hypothetical protein [Paenibacillus durus]AKG34993.1 hypothetical protein VK70_10805 [Paenibacillus durus ATCC 35681]